MINAGFRASIGFREWTLGRRGLGAGSNRYLEGEISSSRRGAVQWANGPGNRALLGIICERKTWPVFLGVFFRRFYRLRASKSTSKSEKTNQELKTLPAPPRTGYSPWIVFVKEKVRQTAVRGKGFIKQCSLVWKNMSEEERQTYKDISSESKLQASRTYMNWINSLSPREIKKENRIRSQLRKEGNRGITLIKDPRKPKRCLSSFLFFCAYARSRPDFIEKYVEGKTRIAEQTKMLAKKWALMGDSEKQEFVNSSINDKERYLRELELYHKL